MDINLISCFGRALPATCAGEKPADCATVKKEAVYARGFTKAAWKRLPLKEKLAYRNT